MVEATGRQKWIERRVRQLLEEQNPGLHERLRRVAEQEWELRAGERAGAAYGELAANTELSAVTAALAAEPPGLPDEPPYEREERER